MSRFRAGIAQLPNAISAGRLALGLCFPLLPPSWYLEALVIGGFSDWLDGFLARVLKVRSVVGQALDPIADKAFIVMALVSLTVAGSIAWWQAALVLARDVSVLAVAISAVTGSQRGAIALIMPSIASKMATALIYLWLIVLLATTWSAVAMTLFVAAALFSMVAAVELALRGRTLGALHRR